MRISRPSPIQLAGVATVWVLTALSLTQPAVAQSVRTREISWFPGVAVATLVEPNDEVLEITRGWVEAIVPARPLTLDEHLNDLVRSSDVVCTITVETVKSVLSVESSWIDTELTGRIGEALHLSGREHLDRESVLTVHVSGGELLFGAVRVRAGDRAPVILPKVLAHEAYLLFLRRVEDVLYTINPPLLIRDGVLSYHEPAKFTNRPQNALAGFTLSKAAEVVKKAAQASPASFPTKFEYLRDVPQ